METPSSLWLLRSSSPEDHKVDPCITLHLFFWCLCDGWDFIFCPSYIPITDLTFSTRLYYSMWASSCFMSWALIKIQWLLWKMLFQEKWFCGGVRRMGLWFNYLQVNGETEFRQPREIGLITSDIKESFHSVRTSANAYCKQSWDFQEVSQVTLDVSWW